MLLLQVLDFMKENLQNLKDMWIKRINYKLNVQCPCTRGSLHFLPLDKCLEKREVACRIEKKPQKLIITDKFKAMFSQDSSIGEPTPSKQLLLLLKRMYNISNGGKTTTNMLAFFESRYTLNKQPVKVSTTGNYVML